jgi:hypothetical protein
MLAQVGKGVRSVAKVVQWSGIRVRGPLSVRVQMLQEVLTPKGEFSKWSVDRHKPDQLTEVLMRHPAIAAHRIA